MNIEDTPEKNMQKAIFKTADKSSPFLKMFCKITTHLTVEFQANNWRSIKAEQTMQITSVKCDKAPPNDGGQTFLIPKIFSLNFKMYILL